MAGPTTRALTRLPLARVRDGDLARAVGGRVVMVTGASDGIGRAVARRLGAAGAHVVLVSRNQERLEQVRELIVEDGGEATVHACDLAEIDEVERLAKDVLERHGRVDVLVNNAGRSIRRSVLQSVDRFHDYERTMQLNYFGPVRLTLALLESMVEHGGGHIINVLTLGVQFDPPRFSAYISSKAALEAFGRITASELRSSNIVVTPVYMGLVRTKMSSATAMYQRVPALSPEQAAERVCRPLVTRQRTVGSVVGRLAAVAHTLAPSTLQSLLHRAYTALPEDGRPER